MQQAQTGKEEECASLTGQIVELQSSLASRDSEKAELTAELASSKEKTQAVMERVKARMKDLSEQLEAKTAEVTTLQESAAQWQGALGSLEGQALEEKQALESKLAEMQQVQAELQSSLILI